MSLESYFKGKRVLVTGAGRGIGKGVVKRLHKYGAVIYALSFNPDGLKRLEKEFPGIKTIAVDLADWQATRKAVEAVKEPIECLINNAGVFIFESFLDIKPESLDKIFKTNLQSVINVSQIVAKQMINNQIHGSIVNISSVGGKRTVKGFGAYSASKAALDMLTQSMALELGQHKISVKALNVAIVETDMGREAIQGVASATGLDLSQFVDKGLERIPLGEAYMPMDQVVNTILFAASTSMMTGSSLILDGGYLVA